jgi:hypothetical protein
MEKGFCLIPIEKLVKADWNYKTNNDTLSEKLTNNIKRNGQIENVIIRELDTGFFEVVNGNHRMDVLNRLGFKDVYCYNLGSISESQAKRIAVETNETRFESDDLLLSKMLDELKNDFSIDDLLMTIPFEKEDFDIVIDNELFTDGENQDEVENKYTNKITTPIYEITKDKPRIEDLIDKSKYESMITEIFNSDLPDSEKEFLKIAALRHIVFKYDKIAEYYAHSDSEMQNLMENSALVIIDFNKAIELGYVVLAEKIAEQYGETYNEE